MEKGKIFIDEHSKSVIVEKKSIKIKPDEKKSISKYIKNTLENLTEEHLMTRFSKIQLTERLIFANGIFQTTFADNLLPEDRLRDFRKKLKSIYDEEAINDEQCKEGEDENILIRTRNRERTAMTKFLTENNLLKILPRNVNDARFVKSILLYLNPYATQTEAREFARLVYKHDDAHTFVYVPRAKIKSFLLIGLLTKNPKSFLTLAKKLMKSGEFESVQSINLIFPDFKKENFEAYEKIIDSIKNSSIENMLATLPLMNYKRIQNLSMDEDERLIDILKIKTGIYSQYRMRNTSKVNGYRFSGTYHVNRNTLPVITGYPMPHELFEGINNKMLLLDHIYKLNVRDILQNTALNRYTENGIVTPDSNYKFVKWTEEENTYTAILTIGNYASGAQSTYLKTLVINDTQLFKGTDILPNTALNRYTENGIVTPDSNYKFVKWTEEENNYEAVLTIGNYASGAQSTYLKTLVINNIQLFKGTSKIHKFPKLIKACKELLGTFDRVLIPEKGINYNIYKQLNLEVDEEYNRLKEYQKEVSGSDNRIENFPTYNLRIEFTANNDDEERKVEFTKENLADYLTAVASPLLETYTIDELLAMEKPNSFMYKERNSISKGFLFLKDDINKRFILEMPYYNNDGNNLSSITMQGILDSFTSCVKDMKEQPEYTIHLRYNFRSDFLIYQRKVFSSNRSFRRLGKEFKKFYFRKREKANDRNIEWTE